MRRIALAALLLLLACGLQTGAAGKAAKRRSNKEDGPTLDQAPSVLRSRTSEAAEAFESAFESTFAGGEDAADLDESLRQYEQMIQWLVTMPATMYSSIYEMHSFAVRETVFDAMQLAAKPYNATSVGTVLDFISTRLTQLTTRYGYPTTRRVIVGALLKKRQETGPFEKDVMAQVVKILLQLFQLHKKSTAVKGLIQFFHISKSGGTNMCQSAESNGCTTEGFDERQNCLVREFGDQPRWVSYNAHKYVQYRVGSDYKNTPWFVNFHTPRKSQDNCAERYAFLKSNKWNFYANEYTVPPRERGICREFVNVMLWRQPLDRLKSQVSWIQKLYKGLYQGAVVTEAFKNRTSGFWERLVPAGVSNYYIRSLLGERFFEFPVVNINNTHVTQAKINVLQHDILLVLEKKKFNDVALKVGLGWHDALEDARIRSSSDIADEIVLPTDYQAMVKRNMPDVQVYDFARELQALDVFLFKFIQALDDNLGLQNMSTERCGYASLGSR